MKPEWADKGQKYPHTLWSHALSPKGIICLHKGTRLSASSSKHLIVSLCLVTSLNTDHEGWIHNMRWLLLLGKRRGRRQIQPERIQTASKKKAMKTRAATSHYFCYWFIPRLFSSLIQNPKIFSLLSKKAKKIIRYLCLRGKKQIFGAFLLERLLSLIKFHFGHLLYLQAYTLRTGGNITFSNRENMHTQIKNTVFSQRSLLAGEWH